MESRKTFRTRGITQNVPRAWNHAKHSARMESRKTFRTPGITQNVPHAWNHAKRSARIPHDASANHKRIRSRICTYGILALIRNVTRYWGAMRFLVVSRSVGGYTHRCGCHVVLGVTQCDIYVLFHAVLCCVE